MTELNPPFKIPAATTVNELMEYWQAHGGKLESCESVLAELEDWLTHRQPLPPEDSEQRSFAE